MFNFKFSFKDLKVRNKSMFTGYSYIYFQSMFTSKWSSSQKKGKKREDKKEKIEWSSSNRRRKPASDETKQLVHESIMENKYSALIN